VKKSRDNPCNHVPSLSGLTQDVRLQGASY
jgi:hypothetical protein